MKKKRKSKGNFNNKVWNACKRIPKGKVSTYKEIARKLDTKAYRAVGNALNKNLYSPQVPCHRVVNSDGKVGGFAFGKAKKIKMLKEEGIKFSDEKIINFEKILYRF